MHFVKSGTRSILRFDVNIRDIKMMLMFRKFKKKADGDIPKKERGISQLDLF